MFTEFTISEPLFNKIRSILPLNSTILELGSGEGTGELSKYYKIFSIEDDKKYIDMFDSTYCYAPIKTYYDKDANQYFWYDKEIVKNFIKDINYNLFLVDAPDGTKYGRDGIGFNINLFDEHLSKNRVPIIIDDTHRTSEEFISNFIKKRYGMIEEIIECENKKATLLTWK